MAQGRLFDGMAETLARAIATGLTVPGRAGISNLFTLATGGNGIRARLSTTVPLPDGSNITEPSGNGYDMQVAWKELPSGATVNVSNAWRPEDMSGGYPDPWTITNGNGGLRWDEATGSWGTIAAIFFTRGADAPSAANLLCYFELDTPVAIDNTDIFQVDYDELSITFGDFVSY